jgi:hypothetical protein
MDPAAGPTHINPTPIHSPAADLPNQIYGARCCFTNRHNCCPDMKPNFMFNFQKLNKKGIIGEKLEGETLTGSNMALIMTIYQNLDIGVRFESTMCITFQVKQQLLKI